MKKVLVCAFVLISFSAAAQPWCKQPIEEQSSKAIYLGLQLSSTMQSAVDFQAGLLFKLPGDCFFGHIGVFAGVKSLRDTTAKAVTKNPDGSLNASITVGTVFTTIFLTNDRFFIVPHLTYGKDYLEIGAKGGYRVDGTISLTVTAAYACKKPEFGAGVMIAF